MKANNADALNLGSSWIGGIAPGGGDIALWDATVTVPNVVVLGADQSWLGMQLTNVGGAVTINAGNLLTLGTSGIDMSVAAQDLTLRNAIVLGSAQSWNVGAGRSLTATGVIDGAGIALTKIGAGTLTLSAANSYTGATVLNEGTTVLNFAAVGAPVSDIVSASSPLQMGGGSLSMAGLAGGASSQTFASTAFTAGLSNISVTPGAGGTAALALGNLTHAINSAVRFTSTGTITVGTASTTTGGLLGVQSGALGIGVASAGYATFGLDDFAALSAGNIVPGTSVAGFYTNTQPATATSIGNFDMIGNATLANGGAQRAANVVRWNTPTATTLTAGTSNLVTFTAALITPNMGANNAAFATGAGGVWQIIRSTNPNGAQQGTIWQNNTLGFFTISIPIVNGREGNSDPSQVVKAGPGTAVLSGVNTYTGRTSVYEGALSVSADNNLGANTAPMTLAGGTLFSNASFTLPATRTVTVTGTGGLAASSGNSFTVASLIGGSGQLVVGSGTLAGTGAGTANPTDVVGNGTVILTNNNFHTGGNAIVGGTANINGINALGGANYGGLTINGGTLQYASTLTSDGDVSIGKGVTLGASGGTIDTNGNAIGYANGLKGAGSLAKTGNGTLTLNAAGTYSGGTTINGGTLKVAASPGSATGAGTVTVNSLGTLAGTGTIGGTVIVNAGGTLAPGMSVGTLTVPGLTLGVDSLLNFEFNNNPANDRVMVTGANGLTLNGGKFSFFADGTANPWSTPGSYNLLSFNGSIGGVGTSALSVINPAAGYSYTFGASGGFVTLTVATSGQISNWASVGGGSWGTSGNWSNGVPDGIGAVAGMGSAIGGNSTVSLNGGKTVGGLTFDNQNSYTVAQGSGGSLTLQKTSGSADLMVFSGNHTISAPVVLGSNISADVAASSTLAVSGQISGAKSVTKRGAGVLSLSSANIYSLGTTLEAGTLEIGNSGALGSAGLAVSGSATLRAGANGLSPANNIAIGAAARFTVDTLANTLTLAGLISDTAGNGALAKTGSGTLILGNANTYGGTSTVSDGVLSVGTLTDGGLPSSIGQSPLTAPSLVLNAGTLRYTGAAATTDRLFTVGTSGATLDASGTGAISFTNPGLIALTGSDTPRTLTLTGTSTDPNTLTPLISDNATGKTALEKSGPGTWLVSGTNTFTGATVVSGGTLALGNTLALQGSTLDYNNQGGTLSFDALFATTLGGITGTQGLVLLNSSALPVALTVGANNVATNYGGVLSDIGSLIKVGTGVLTLSGVNTFTGTTTINGGAIRLNVSDALQGTTQVFVNVGGGLLLSNGVVANMPLTATVGAGEFLDVPDAGAAATFGGAVTQAGGGNQYRLGISGAGAVLTVTGTHTVNGTGNISFITRGNIVFAGSAALNINTANDTFQFGRFAGQGLTMTLKDNASVTAGAIGIGGGSAGGAVSITVQDNASITASLGKNFELHSINANVTSNLHLNGGSITAGSFTKFQTAAGRETTINLNGGTIRAGATNVNFLPALTGLTVNVQAGGGIIDTNGFDITIAQPIVHDPALGITPDGGIDKNGAGTLTFDGAQTYSSLDANAGITNLHVPLGTGDSTVHVANLAILNFGDSQTLASLVIDDGGIATLGTPPPAPASFAGGFEAAVDLAAGGAQAVPEPGSVALLLGGMLTLLGLRRRP